MNLKKIGKLFTSKSAGTGPSSYKKRIYQAAVSQRLRNTELNNPKYETDKSPPLPLSHCYYVTLQDWFVCLFKLHALKN